MEKRGQNDPPYLSSEVQRVPTEVNCITSNVVSFVLNKTIKNSKQIITIVGNFQHTDHYFFGHNNRKKVIVCLVKSGSYAEYCAAQFVLLK